MSSVHSRSDAALPVHDKGTPSPDESWDAAVVIAQSPLFDADWYAALNPGVRISGADPATHYLQVGALMGRDPGPTFDSRAYLAAYPDVAAAGLNPLLHYEHHGRKEGRRVPAPGSGLTPIATAIAASTSRPSGWAMTRSEAETIMLKATAPWKGEADPRRLLQRFDTLAARRYVAAATALHGDAIGTLKATVVMPTHNRADRVERAVRSVLGQSHRNLELLVVDDGSTDDTAARLALLPDPRLKVVSVARGGVSAARNVGLEHATGEYVFYLDSDNAWTTDHLRLMLTGLHATGAECGYAASCLVARSGKPAGYRGEPFDWDACLAKNYVDLNVFAHRTGLVRELGGFDTDLRRTVDWDLVLRTTKGRAVAFLPYVGCLYHDDAKDPTRITNAEPRLYRRMVIEKARRDLGSAGEALAAMKLSFGIKIAAPAHQREEWGDFHYAQSLAAALIRRGHSARIDFRDHWSDPETRKDDVALMLHGLSGYVPRRGQLSLLWLISHPDRIPYEEYDRYDAVMVASHSYAALLSMILDRPVEGLLQCTDATRFHLPEDMPAPGPRGLFVGNSRNEYRQMVRWSVENDIDLDIYGARWKQFIPAQRIVAKNLPNARLGAAYAQARFVLNDHWPSMKEFGFVSNRVFDVLASGGRLISDRLPALEAMFGNAVESVENEAEFCTAVARFPPPSARRREVADYVAEHHSFDARAERIEGIVKDSLIGASRKSASPSREKSRRPEFVPSARRRNVGLLIERDGAGWSRSAHIRLIAPLTTDHAHAIAGLDVIALDGPDDPRLGACDLCIVQNAAIRDLGTARQLTEMLGAREVPLYVDIDDTFPHDRPEGDDALRRLMAAARETWFSSEVIAVRHDDKTGGRSRIRPDAIDPRYWHNYRVPPKTDFGDGPVRLVCLDAGLRQHDLEPILLAVERIALDRPGRVELTLVRRERPVSGADWLRVLEPPKGGYPAFARFLARDLALDVGLAPNAAAQSDFAFLHYGAMGLLPVVAEGAVHRSCIGAGFAIGCDPSQADWYRTLDAIVAQPAAFADMRRRAAAHVRSARNVLSDPMPLADLLRGKAA